MIQFSLPPLAVQWLDDFKQLQEALDVTWDLATDQTKMADIALDVPGMGSLANETSLALLRKMEFLDEKLEAGLCAAGSALSTRRYLADAAGKFLQRRYPVIGEPIGRAMGGFVGQAVGEYACSEGARLPWVTPTLAAMYSAAEGVLPDTHVTPTESAWLNNWMSNSAEPVVLGLLDAAQGEPSSKAPAAATSHSGTRQDDHGVSFALVIGLVAALERDHELRAK